MDLKTVTNNCVVSDARRTGEKGKKYFKVNSVDELIKLENNARKRKYVQVARDDAIAQKVSLPIKRYNASQN